MTQKDQKTAQKVGLGVLLIVILLVVVIVLIFDKISKSNSQNSEKSQVSGSVTVEQQTQEASDSNWTEQDKEKLAKFLAERGVVLYYGNSCPHCHNQLEKFGKAADLLKKVDCYLEENSKICEQAKISGVPTWIYNEERKEGTQTLDDLANWVGYNR